MTQGHGSYCRTPTKRAFDSEQEAKRAARRHRKYLTVYECRCGKWHLTKKANVKRFRRGVARRLAKVE